jgi:hypothetical protein
VPSMMDTRKPKLLSRRESVAFIRGVLGKPLSLSTFHKACAAGAGPPPAERWGSRPFYRPADGRRWAEERARP